MFPSRLTRVTLLALTMGGVLLAQSSTSNWSNLSALTSGQAVRVRLSDGSSLRGAFQSFNLDEVTLQIGTADRTLARTVVLDLAAQTQGHRRRNALIGAGAGAGVGLAYCGAMGNSIAGCRDTTPRAKGWLVSTGFFAAIGAIVGAVLPSRGWRTLYRAR